MYRRMILGVLLALIVVVAIVCQKGPTDEELLLASRKVTDGYMGELKMALSSAISQGGVASAVDVCSELAPEVARKFSASHGWEVKRVSHKIRNPNNAPDDFESKGLEILAGGTQGSDEYFAWIDDSGKKTFRYMKAIKTGELCLNCHGDPGTFSPELKQILSAKYPNDKATGFRVGDFRGAFSIKIEWPEGKAGVDSINRSL